MGVLYLLSVHKTGSLRLKFSYYTTDGTCTIATVFSVELLLHMLEESVANHELNRL